MSERGFATPPFGLWHRCAEDFGLWLAGAPCEKALPPDADEQFQQGFEEAVGVQRSPAQWAYDRAVERLDTVDPRVAAGSDHTSVAAWIITAFARMIEEHEEPPEADPLIAEVREILAWWYERNPEKVLVGSRDPANIREGSMDETPEFSQAMKALRHGMEIGEGNRNPSGPFKLPPNAGDTITFKRSAETLSRRWVERMNDAEERTDSVLELIVRTAFPATDVRLIDGKVKALRNALDRHGLDVKP